MLIFDRYQIGREIALAAAKATTARNYYCRNASGDSRLSRGFIVDEVSIPHVRLLVSPRLSSRVASRRVASHHGRIARLDRRFGNRAAVAAADVLFGKQFKFPGDESDIAEAAPVTCRRLLRYSGNRRKCWINRDRIDTCTCICMYILKNPLD